MHRFGPLVLLALFAARLPAADPPAPVGTRVADFALPDPAAGTPWELADRTRGAKAVVVVFTRTACPVSAAYLPRLKELAKQYESKGVVFVGVASAPEDDAATLAKAAAGAKLPFPVLRDDGTKLADRLGVERVPTAFVLDAAKAVRYKGRVDDQFAPGVHRAKATTRELADALDAVLDGKEVAAPFAPPAGCLLTREKPAKAPAGGEAVTFHGHVARVLNAKCLECHRPGEAGPFALTSYAAAKNWADMIREVVSENVMPPWSADAPLGHFKNDRRLTPDEKKTLLDWIDQGCPEGDPKLAPQQPKFVPGWRLGREPDEVIAMKKPIRVPATSRFGVNYQYVEVGEPLAEDKWVTGIEVRPGYRAVVHHIIAFMIPPGGGFQDIVGEDFGSHMLGAYVPGDQPMVAPPGTARKLKKGAKVIFEMHYTPNGVAGDDLSSVGLLLTKEKPARELENRSIMNGRFRIPPGAEGHVVTSEHVFPEESTILSLTPHMHLRGKSFKYELFEPGKAGPEVLLNVPKYDFNWQVGYELAKPRVVPAGAKLVCTAVYDNSAKNPFNPDPKKRVTWGQQTTDEMMIGFVTYHAGK